MVKYCVANECPIDEWACAIAAKTVISRYSNTYAKKPKRLGIFGLPLGRLKMVIFTYSNILSSVSLINIDELACERCSRVRPLRLFEVLTRNRQSALGLSGRTRRALEQPLRMFTIPPRQQLSLTTRLVLRRRNFTHLVINTHTHTHERETHREKEIHHLRL